MELVDLQLIGGVYTWTCGDNHEISSRIDRFLVSAEWNDCFTNIKQEILPKICSDHTPLVLQCGKWEQKKSYFKFENWWLETEGFTDRVRNWWTSFIFEGRPDYILACKLKALKGRLKEWSQSNYGNVEIRKNLILHQISELDAIQQLRGLNEEQKIKRANLFMEFEENAKREEIAWRQRSRTLWLKQGDRNTKFFQRMANAHRRNNNIDQLLVEGETIEEPEAIKREITNFYTKLYSETENWRPTCSMHNCCTITEEEQQALQSPFDEKEIFECLKLCAIDKAPGPDRYSMVFFIKYWEVVKLAVVATIQNFHSQEMFEKSFNATCSFDSKKEWCQGIKGL